MRVQNCNRDPIHYHIAGVFEDLGASEHRSTYNYKPAFEVHGRPLVLYSHVLEPGGCAAVEVAISIISYQKSQNVMILRVHDCTFTTYHNDVSGKPSEGLYLST